MHVLPAQPNEAPEIPVIVAMIVPVGFPTPGTGGCVSVSVTWMVHLELSAVVMVDGSHDMLVPVERFVTETIAGAAALSLPE